MGVTEEYLLRVVLALDESHEAYGEWPATLEELAPLFTGALPADPLDGVPFRYGRREALVLVWAPERPEWSFRRLEWILEGGDGPAGAGDGR